MTNCLLSLVSCVLSTLAWKATLITSVCSFGTRQVSLVPQVCLLLSDGLQAPGIATLSWDVYRIPEVSLI